MATSGSASVAVTSYDTLKFSWAVDSQSIADNNSVVDWKLELITTANGAISSTASKSWTVTVNGNKYSGTNTVGIGSNATKTLASGSTTIAHNADGTKSFSYSFSQYFGITFSGVSIGTKSGTGSGTLTTIPRKSTMTVSNGTLGTALTLDVSRASTSFTHTITYLSGSYSGTIASKSASTILSWTPPVDLANGAPNGEAVFVSFTIETFNGNTSLGTNKYSIYCDIPNSVVPTVSFTLADPMGHLATYGGYVQGKSKFDIDVTASGAYGSKIVAYKVEADGKTYSTAQVDTDVIAGSGAMTVKVTVTDSRGRTATASKNVNAFPYYTPKITTMAVYRSDASGNKNARGAYLTLQYNIDIASLNLKNTADRKVKYKPKAGTTYQEATITGGIPIQGEERTYYSGKYTFSADVSYSYDVILSVNDDFSETDKFGAGASTAKVFSIFKEGMGFAFGKVAEIANALEIAWDIYDKHGTQIRNGLAFYEANGSTDADTTLEELFLSANNTPDNSLYYVRQLFYNAKTSTSARTQVATPYVYDNATPPKSNYRRHYIAGVGWGAWIEEPVIVEQGTSGIWTYTKWSDGRAELLGKIAITNLACTTAMGSMFRTSAVVTDNFPFSLSNIYSLAEYEADSNGALVWANTKTSNTKAPNYYLVRATSSTITGVLKMRVTGSWN